MNYKYTSPDDEQNKGQGGFQIIMPFLPGQGPQQQYNDPNEKVSAEFVKDFQLVKLRALHANARASEIRVILAGMQELRDALQMAQVNAGDTGTSERPPLTPAFDDVNHGKLQNAYLTMVERYVNYTDFMLTSELKIKTTNEIKKV